MVKNAVITLAVGSQSFWSLTHPLMKNYANSINADFIIINSAPSFPHLVASYKLGKFQLKEYLTQYERVIFLDGDIALNPKCPNLFELVATKDLGVVCEKLPHFNRQVVFQEACEFYQVPHLENDQEWFNTGMMVISRCHSPIFNLPTQIREFVARNLDGSLAPAFSWLDMPLLNALRLIHNITIHDLGYQFNYLQSLETFNPPPFPPESAWIYHSAGSDKSSLDRIVQQWHDKTTH